ncbi:GNAT family N-acetyltransferase [Candidatus Villigracilis saccharophilus]|uniref:GNAT family N-acetyltransferase n=1 Tax=Candidatus Villigracilis saccharophilus TaxID=3140684 RepID=UPI003136C6E6|nr:GNAT family N-acetyltransferase [Anaerolineales bacterium]
MTRSFEDYFVPVNITDIILLAMLRRDGIDLTSSRVIMKDDQPSGLALIARRGWASRLAAMGLVSTARNGGTGTWAMRQLIEEAGSRGEKEMLLEVIEQNTAAVKLYEKFGFTKIRRLVGYRLDTSQIDSAALRQDQELQEIDIRELAQMVSYHGLEDLPWQLSGTTIAHHTPPSRAFCLKDAYCLVSNPETTDVAISSVLVKSPAQRSRLERNLDARFLRDSQIRSGTFHRYFPKR